MMRRWIFPLLALAVLLCAACGASREEQGRYQLYFVPDATVRHGPAIQSQPYGGREEPGLEELAAALLSGPTQDGLASPFPRGLTLRSASLEDGVLALTFSEQYGGLTDISLTLADYCVVLSMCQLEGVQAVEISAAGHTAAYRSHLTLLPEEVLLSQQLPQPDGS